MSISRISSRAAGALAAGLVSAGVMGGAVLAQIEPAQRPLRLVKSATVTGAERIGDSFGYILDIRNGSPEPAAIRVLDVLPSEVDLIGSETVITSTTPITAAAEVFAPPGVESISWGGTLPGNSAMRIAFRVKLVACPPPISTAPVILDRAVRNTAVLNSQAFTQSSTHAFLPEICRPAVTGTPKPVITRTPPPTPAPGADVFVRKFARLHPDVTDPDRGWVASWYVGYGNYGRASANNTQIKDAPSDNQTISGFRSAPIVTPTIENGAYLINIGDMQPGAFGAFLMRSRLPFNTPSGTVLSNTVAIRADRDANAENNSDAARLTLPHLPPLITYPRPGVTCDGVLTITGRAQIGEIVEVEIDRTRVATVTADSEGRWQLPVTLDNGFHTIGAYTRGVNAEVRRGPQIWIKVDNTLVWDPISLTFMGDDGERHRARHWRGWLDYNGWYVTLAPSSTYTVGVRICCDTAAVVTLTVPGTGAVSLTDPEGDGRYTASFKTAGPRALVSGPIGICVTNEGVTQCARGRVLPLIRSDDARRRHVILITRDGFDLRRIPARRGDLIEFVNMDEETRSLSTQPNLMSVAIASSGQVESDGLSLEPGESTVIEVQNEGAVFYDAIDPAQSVTVGQGAAVYLPSVGR
jgi:hypothetical protein